MEPVGVRLPRTSTTRLTYSAIDSTIEPKVIRARLITTQPAAAHSWPRPVLFCTITAMSSLEWLANAAVVAVVNLADHCIRLMIRRALRSCAAPV
jgi:hypothetical protein